ncbi:hypothetical protein ABIB58_003085 [Brevundimonas sp. UYEF29]
MTAGFSLRRPLGERLDVVADGGLSYVDASRLTFDGRERYHMRTYGTGRLALSVQASARTATVFVDTLFDTEANSFAYSDI